MLLNRVRGNNTNYDYVSKSIEFRLAKDGVQFDVCVCVFFSYDLKFIARKSYQNKHSRKISNEKIKRQWFDQTVDISYSQSHIQAK